ncbi:hypothetical protein [Modestobacter sp. NPDC049651]|uniref:hypothetical protein n=1 Tax=unclassified Modestobacter TaxID=2643866 RepID=UPI0033E3F4CA
MTRRPVLPGAAELFRRTDSAAAVATAPAAPVTELPTLAAAQASPALRAPAPRLAPEPAEVAAVAPAPQPLALVPDTRPAAPQDELAAYRGPAPVSSRTVQPRANSGRTRHDEKITVYCSAEELLALESARLQLRGQFGIAADRGRIVREAIAVLLADLENNAEDSVLVRRLRRG